MTEADSDYLIIGRINGLFGVRGWVKVYSHTEPRDNILTYRSWYLRDGHTWREVEPAEGKVHGKGIIARIKGCDDRDAATALVGSDIAIRREQLHQAQEGEYYWADLIGLEVITSEGVELGRVDHLMETGANDVLVVQQGKRERLIPYIPGQVICEVDLTGKRLVVDWDPEF